MKVLLFREHAGDPLCALISALSRSQYTHAAVLTDEAKLEIHEAYFPQVRVRTLAPAELAGIDVFAINGLTLAGGGRRARLLRRACGRSVLH